MKFEYHRQIMPEQKNIKLSYSIHRQQAVVRIDFVYNTELAALVKAIEGASWSRTMGAWYIPQAQFDLHRFFETFRGKAWVNYEALKHIVVNNQEHGGGDTKQVIAELKVELPAGYHEMLEQKRYSANTQKIYISYMRDFATMFRKFNLKELTKEQINRYILWLIREKGISASQQNQRINAIKFYYEKVLGQPRQLYEIDRPRKGRSLPEVLSKEEVKRMLEVAENRKHKCLIALIYTCGLRRSEAINLKLGDVDSKRMMIRISEAKGDKDRYVNFPTTLLNMLRDYYLEYKPAKYVFEGHPGRRIVQSRFGRLLNKLRAKRVFGNGFTLTFCVIALQLTTLSKVLIFAIFRNGWATKALKQPNAIPTLRMDSLRLRTYWMIYYDIKNIIFSKLASRQKNQPE